MKKILLLFTISLMAVTTWAQEPRSISLNLYGGYTFTDRLRFDATYGDVKGAFEYGAGVEYFVQRNSSLEIKYTRMGTDVPLYLNNGTQINKGSESGTIQFITFGGNYYFAKSLDAKMIPFIGGALGVGITSNDNNTETKFGWDAQLGVKLRTKGAAAFKIRAYIQNITAAYGYDYWWYPGWGSYAVPDYISLFQFGLGGVIVFDFKKK